MLPGNFRFWRAAASTTSPAVYGVCFRLRIAIATALADNPVGRLLEDLLLQGGVDLDLLRWAPSDDVGRTVRNGPSFTERGYGVSAASGCSDRGHTAISQVKYGDFD